MKCQYCGQEHPSDMKFCPETGEKITLSQVRFCVKCGNSEIPQNAKFCPKCSSNIDSGETNNISSSFQQKKHEPALNSTPADKNDKFTPFEKIFRIIGAICALSGLILGGMLIPICIGLGLVLVLSAQVMRLERLRKSKN